MKIVLLILCFALAGCGAKSKEDIAKELIKEKLKATLPDFSKYESLNFGTMGTASLPYEETDQYKKNVTTLTQFKDSLSQVQKFIQQKTVSAVSEKNLQLEKLLQDSVIAQNEKNKIAKQSYTPETLFRISHAYLLKAANSPDVKMEEYYYLDEGLKKVVKIQKVY